MGLKQQLVARLLTQVGSDWLLVLDPANVRWLTSGACQRGLRAPDEEPALLMTHEYRWLVCSNCDSQRLFDEEVDQLGFQLKEWPWAVGKRRVLEDLTRDRDVITDRPFGTFDVVGDRLRRLRLELTDYEAERLRELGGMIAHAVEATARNFPAETSEEEIAGQVGHRLLHHSITPAQIQVTGDDRLPLYRRAGFSNSPVGRCCHIAVTGERGGLFATVARTVWFGEPPEEFRADFDDACRLSAALISGSRRAIPVKGLFDSCRSLLPEARAEIALRDGPTGYFTGHSAVESVVGSRPGESFHNGQAVIWPVRVGQAITSDTILIGDDGGEVITRTDEWPTRVAKVGGWDVPQADILSRKG